MSKLTLSLSAPAFPDELPTKKQLKIARSALLELFKGIGNKSKGDGHSVQTFAGNMKGQVLQSARKIVEPLITSGVFAVKKVDTDQLMPKMVMGMVGDKEVGVQVSCASYVVVRGETPAFSIQSYSFGDAKPVAIACINLNAFEELMK